MSVLFNNIVNALEWIEHNTDSRIKGFWLMGSIWPTVIILIAYLYFVLKIGPEFMKYRNPMNIDNIVMVYNVIQVLFSLYTIKEIFRLVWLRDDYRLFCIELSNDSDIAAEQVNMVWMCLMNKYLDLLDTVFFVLRKKQNQVTFLHVYHHTLVVTFGWYISNFYPGRQVIFFATMNTFVHSVMYSYYLLTILNPEYKKAWWKKYLTMMQLVQFVIAGVHVLISLFEPNCNFPRILILLAIPQDIFMFVLFYDFYKKAYVKSKNNK